ncbi:hypothetical protein [Streptomyces cupreus]|uniref:hypothetical protein n=1 Tax=Streptomyces cupreus TaxID=2759956 RepID=UPI003AB98167
MIIGGPHPLASRPAGTITNCRRDEACSNRWRPPPPARCPRQVVRPSPPARYLRRPAGPGAAAPCRRSDGLVVAAFGVGHVPQRLVESLERLAARIPAVLSSRIGNGPVLTRTYGFPGSEKDLISRGLIPAGNLGPYQARLLLHGLLAQDADREMLTEKFSLFAR